MAFHPKVRQVAAACNDGAVQTWDLEHPHVRAYKFCGHSEAVTSVCFSRSGKLLASSSKDRTVRLWENGVEGKSSDFKAHTSAVNSVQFSPINDTLITASDDKTVKLWTVQGHRFVRSFATNNAAVRCAKFSPDGELIATVSDDKTVRLYDADTGREIHVFHETKGAGVHLDWHPGSNCLGVAFADKKVKVYDCRMLKLQQLYSSHEGPVSQVSFHPSGNFLASGSEDGSLKIYDLLEARPIYDLLGHKGPVTAVKFSAKGNYFASGEKERLVFVWKTNFVEEEPPTAAPTPSDTPKSRRPVGTPKKSDQQQVLKESKIPQPSETKSATGMMEKMTLGENKENRGHQDQNDLDEVSVMREQLAETNAQVARLQAINAEANTKIENLTQTLLLMEKRLTLVENQLKVTVGN